MRKTKRKAETIPPPPRFTIHDAIQALHNRHLWEGGTEENWQPPSSFMEDWQVNTDPFGQTEFVAIGNDGRPIVRVTFPYDWDMATIYYADGRIRCMSIGADALDREPDEK